MKAMLCEKFGPPEDLVLKEVADLIPLAGQVRIATEACGVNFPDTLIIENKYQFKPDLPFAPGGEVTGIVDAVGDGVSQDLLGQPVMCMTLSGGFAEQTLCKAEDLIARPSSMPSTVAAGFTMTYGTSMHALKQRAQLQAGETLLVLGAGGGVGLAAATDICFACESALIKLSELSIGIGPFVIEPAVKRKIGNAAMAQLTLKAQTFFSAKWACEKGLYANVFETNKALNSEVDILAKELQCYNPEALLSYKKILWQGTEDWDALLESRATLSGQLVLSPKAKSYLEKYS